MNVAKNFNVTVKKPTDPFGFGRRVNLRSGNERGGHSPDGCPKANGYGQQVAGSFTWRGMDGVATASATRLRVSLEVKSARRRDSSWHGRDGMVRSYGRDARATFRSAAATPSFDTSTVWIYTFPRDGTATSAGPQSKSKK